MGNIYGGRDPWEVPAYTLPVAARLVRVPPATLRYWVVGRKGVGRDGEERLPQPLIQLASGDGRRKFFSFTNLVEAHVLASMRRKHEISMPMVRRALSFVETELGTPNPLAKERFRTDGRKLFIEQMSALVDVTTGHVVAEGLLHGFERIRYEEGLAMRFFPYVREVQAGAGEEPNLDQPMNIEMDPRIAFGRPVISGTNIPADEISGRFKAGDDIACLCEEFGLDAAQVEEAVRAAGLASAAA